MQAGKFSTAITADAISFAEAVASTRTSTSNHRRSSCSHSTSARFPGGKSPLFLRRKSHRRMSPGEQLYRLKQKQRISCEECLRGWDVLERLLVRCIRLRPGSRRPPGPSLLPAPLCPFVCATDTIDAPRASNSTDTVDPLDSNYGHELVLKDKHWSNRHGPLSRAFTVHTTMLCIGVSVVFSIILWPFRMYAASSAEGHPASSVCDDYSSRKESCGCGSK